MHKFLSCCSIFLGDVRSSFDVVMSAKLTDKSLSPSVSSTTCNHVQGEWPVSGILVQTHFAAIVGFHNLDLIISPFT